MANTAKKPQKTLASTPQPPTTKKKRARKQHTPKLTARQHRFVLEYIRNGGNAARAYMRSGFKLKNPALAKVAAHRLMEKPHVRAAIDQELAKIAKRAEVSVDRLIREVDRIALASVKELYDDMTGKTQLIPDLPDDIVAAIRSVEETPNGQRVSFWDKLKALELALKLRGALSEDLKITTTASMGVLVVPGLKSLDEWNTVVESYKAEAQVEEGPSPPAAPLAQPSTNSGDGV